MTNPRRRTETVVGRITVHLDSGGNVYRFTDPAGNERGCICQPGIRCQWHLQMGLRSIRGSDPVTIYPVRAGPVSGRERACRRTYPTG
jgi:hypothetical protein